jgi:N-acetylglucosaminyl-diphospho-decaprenol L-rhamnosyltransferase
MGVIDAPGRPGRDARSTVASREEVEAAGGRGSAEWNAVSLNAVTAVIVNWETPDYTIRAVSALLDDGLQPAQLVVVDNGSRDGSYERLVDALPGCVMVSLPENIGFGRAANVGARQRESDSYLFVNNDAFVHRPGTVRAMLEALEPFALGIVVPRVLNEDLTLQRTVSALQTPGVALVRASGLSRLIPNRWQPSWGAYWDHGKSREIQQAACVVFLVRSETWKQLGGFDERMTLSHAEDLDLCLRARQSGWKVWFSADGEFVHIGSASTRRWSNPARREMEGRSEGMMIRRNLGPIAATLSLAFITAGLVVRSSLFRLAGRSNTSADLWASVRGYLARDPG